MKCGPGSGVTDTTGLDSNYLAEYGVTGRFGDITCLSQTTGFQCTNADGHGFFLSRRVQRIY